MTKRLVDIDDESLEAARRVLGAGTIKETVNTSLAEVARRDERAARVAAALAKFPAAAQDLGDDEVMRRAWS